MLLERLRPFRIILASASPRRRELLNSAGLKFELVTDFTCSETFPDNLPGNEIPLFLARKKSLSFPRELSLNEILITADTVVLKDGIILEKPNNEGEARSLLSRISDSFHYVYTGVYFRSVNKSRGFITGTKVVFDPLSEEEINYYIQHYNPYDKAGGYGVQEWIGLIGVKEISGSYTNVMGLPVNRLFRELEKFVEKQL